MSFYGDITNTSRTHFQFDRIYANRAEMEQYKESDGIYAGRFVLIEYDNEMHMDSFLRVRKDGNNFYTTFSDNTSQEVLLTKGKIHKDTIVYESAFETLPANGYYAKNCTFYKCTSDYVENSKELATFEDIVGVGEENPHITNYSIDLRMYGRGYDSTVWQKVYDGGIERYMMIAELNTVIPTFDLQPDAPTQTPIVPHFDIQGSDIYYKLHHQPAWGFRVKSANPEEGPEFKRNGEPIKGTNILYTTQYPESGYDSDETTEWVRTEYNPDTGHLSTLYWHSGNSEDYFEAGEWKDYPPEEKMPAAIYYNKAGFNPEIITKSTLDDHITIEGSGISGHQYSSHDEVGIETSYPDIQEISMMLPSIGNSIANMWDIIYGNELMSTEQTEDGQLKRNLDISWDSTKGLRMVTNKSDGNGFEYNTNQVSTLAGAINSVHDLMGMIIINPDEPMSNEFAKKAEDNKIYYSNGKYYYRTNDYVYDTENKISAVEEDRLLTEDEIKNFSYKPVNDNFKNFPPEDESFYYGTVGQVYKLETNNYPTYNRTYYATKDKTPFFKQINPVKFEKDKHYKFVTEEYNQSNPDGSVSLFQIGYYTNEDDAPKDGISYYELLNNEIIEIKSKPYIPGVYYIYNVPGNIGAEIGSVTDNVELKDIIISTGPYNSNYTYYVASIEDGELILEKADLFGVTKNNYYRDLINKRYYRCGYNYIPNLDKVLADPKRYKFVYIPEQEPINYFYMPNKYYLYNENTGEYKICNQKELNTIFNYYARANDANIRTVDLIAEKYYVSNTYYYQDQDSKRMILDKNKTASTDLTYYYRDKILYVYEDANDIMNIGMEWNVNVTTIPAGITVTTRELIPTMKELEGFARELNTIHGLILKINQLLLTNDMHTRDTGTIQGVINIINDIIDKFEIIAPGQFIIVDDYGRIHSVPHHTDNWININVDGRLTKKDETEEFIIPNEPNIMVTHEFHPLEEGSIEAIAIAQEKEQEDKRPYSKDKDAAQQAEGYDYHTIINPNKKVKPVIEFDSLLVDEKGHVTGVINKAFILPNGFQHIIVKMGIPDNPIDDKILGAISYNDQYGIEGDQWIQLNVTTDINSVNTIHYKHETHDIQEITNPEDLDLDFTNLEAIIMPSVNTDEAGHITSKNFQKIKLGSLWSKIEKLESDLSQANTTITGLNTTIANLNTRIDELSKKIE